MSDDDDDDISEILGEEVWNMKYFQNYFVPVQIWLKGAK